ncbi:MAG TPA: ROK family protein [Dehalococcoidales bacterium]|nr:ROK family protein [Dehalococcoidales bacterium]
MRSLYGGIEAGGTKFVCAVGTGPDDVRAETRFATTTPSETIGRTIAFFREQPEPLAAIGIGSFGPLDLNPDSPTYGYITTTPKTGWAHTNFAGVLQEALNVQVLLDIDINTAALGEHKWGAAQGLDTFIYLTVGTGIGGGGMVNGHLIHGLAHPEMGHVYIPHDPVNDPYPGCCPYHGDCLEGLACGPAIEKRWGQPPQTLPADHPAWRLEARYLALGLVNIIFTLSPQRVIIGGGVLQQESLLPMVRKNVHELIRGYVPVPQFLNETDSYIVLPALGQKAGVLGAIALAQQATPLP